MGKTFYGCLTELELWSKNWIYFDNCHDGLVRDRIVAGVRQKLLSEAKLILTRSRNICQTCEKERDRMKSLKRSSSLEDKCVFIHWWGRFLSLVVGLFSEKYVVSEITYVQNANSFCVNIISVQTTAKNTVISPNFLVWKFIRKLCLSTKFPHQKIRWNYGIFRGKPLANMEKETLRFGKNKNNHFKGDIVLKERKQQERKRM